MPFRRLFVTVGWTSTPIAKFSLDPGVTGAQNRAILLMTLSGIFGIVSTYNIHVNLFYISSADNPADTPSRVFPLKDSKLSPSAWVQVLWMVPPFLSFPHIPFLAQSGCPAS